MAQRALKCPVWKGVMVVCPAGVFGCCDQKMCRTNILGNFPGFLRMIFAF